MNELVTRWDWICMGLVAGFIADRVFNFLMKLAHIFADHMDLRLNHETRKCILAINKELKRMEEEAVKRRGQDSPSPEKP